MLRSLLCLLMLFVRSAAGAPQSDELGAGVSNLTRTEHRFLQPRASSCQQSRRRRLGCCDRTDPVHRVDDSLTCTELPQCDVTDGSRGSSESPCWCGQRLCSIGQSCSDSDGKCEAILWYGSRKVNNKSFWKDMRGIGFSPADHRGHEPFGTSKVSMGRLDDALEKVVENGYNMIRVWRMTPYQKLILERIREKSLDIKVQIAVDCDIHGWISDAVAEQHKRLIDNAVSIAQQFPELILGLSVGNENMASWMHAPHDIAYKIKDRAEYARQTYGIPVTYNFVSENVWEKAGFQELVQELDYVNMHMYGAPIYDMDGQSWYTPDKHFEAVKENENIRYQKIPNDKPLIIGETGWLTGSRRPANLKGVSYLYDYYKLITKHVYGTPLENRKAVSMFYFELNNEEWKGHDNGWGLYDEGDQDVIGEPGTGAPRIEVVNVDDILNMTA